MKKKFWPKKLGQKFVWVKKIGSENCFGLGKILGPKKIWLEILWVNKFWSEIFLGQKKIGPKFFLGQKKFVLQYFLGQKFGLEIFLGKSNLDRNFVRVKKIWAEICFGQILFWSYKICLCYADLLNPYKSTH